MFDVKLRDELLFEDENFTFSRRYFWAYNTLTVLNDGIRSMQKAYYESFTEEFWEGRHSTIWPHPKPDSAEGKDYLQKMNRMRTELESAIVELESIYKRNARTQKLIESLRNQLFSGSSVRESRKAIEQGDNIKVLTTVSMVFLPLSFVIVSHRRLVDEEFQLYLTSSLTKLSPSRFSASTRWS
jgi:Mg2+ and Co2+ transporter CorA